MTPGMSLYGDEYNSLMSHIQRHAEETTRQIETIRADMNSYMAEQDMKMMEWEARFEELSWKLQETIETLTETHR